MQKNNGLKRQKIVRRQRAKRLLKGARISEAKIRKIIAAYAERKTVREAARDSGASHVTVGRIFNLIRERLLVVGVYRSAEAYRDEKIDIENSEEGAYFFAEAFERQLNALIGDHRGIDDKNRHLYEAEALYRIENPHATELDIVVYILTAIKETGPLGALDPSRVPRAVFEAQMRRLFDKLDRDLTELVRLAKKDRKLH